MPHCLEIAEIISLIIDQFTFLDARTLANLASTSRIFRGPATSALWSFCRGIDRLLDAMGDDLWERLPTELPNPLQLEQPQLRALKRELQASDIENFRNLAAYVKTLVIDGYGQVIAPLVAIQAAMEPPSQEPLFPHLRHLTLRAPLLSFDTLSTLLSPAMTTLSIILSDNDSLVEDMHQLHLNLHERCPGVTEFNYHTHTPNVVRLPRELHRVITQWKSLRSLRIGCDSFQLLLELSHLPCLKDLDLNACSINTRGLRLDELPRGGFKALQQLMVNFAADLASPEAILRLCDMSPIRILTFGIGSIPEPGQMRGFFRLLHQHIAHDSLELLQYTEGLDIEPRGITAAEIAAANTKDDSYGLSAFHSFANLDSLTIYSNMPYRTCVNTLVALGNHIPKLRRLRLSNWDDYPFHFPRTLSLPDLIPVSQAMPYLSQLEVPVDASNVVPSTDRVPDNVRHAALHRLTLGCTPIDSPEDVALFLSDLFPNLDDVQGAASEQTGTNSDEVMEMLREGLEYERWKSVGCLVKFARRIRAQYPSSTEDRHILAKRAPPNYPWGL